MPPCIILSRVRATGWVSPRSSRNSSELAGGNLGAPPKPPLAWSKLAWSPETARVEDRLRRAAASDWPTWPVRPSDSRILRRGLAELLALVAVGAGGRLQHLLEAGQAVARLRREVGAAVEGDGLGVEEDGQRPAALARHPLDGLHVEVVDVGPLLAVDLDRDEATRSSARRSPRPRRTRAPSRGTSGRRSSRSRA